jgi:hypothetical protein
MFLRDNLPPAEISDRASSPKIKLRGKLRLEGPRRAFRRRAAQWLSDTCSARIGR